MNFEQKLDEFMTFLATKTGWKEYYHEIGLPTDITDVENEIKEKIKQLHDPQG